MKKIYLIALVVLTLAFLLAPSCKPGNVKELDQEFQLRPGQQASIAGEDLKIDFVRVTEDSRCATGNTCIWEGRAVCLLNITRAGIGNEVSFIQMGSNDQTDEVYLGYHFVFNVTPYPVAGNEIQDGDYRLILKVTRQA